MGGWLDAVEIAGFSDFAGGQGVRRCQFRAGSDQFISPP